MSTKNLNHEVQERLLQIIKRPHVSEKATLISEKHRQFIFIVASDSNKHEIKQSVETLFKVKVNSVRVCNAKGKSRRFKQMVGQRKDSKKAYVSLEQGFDIDFTGNK